MKFVIAGFGSIGRRHFRNLVSLGEQEIILLRSFNSTLDHSEISSYVQVSSINDALKLNPDAIIIANPTSLHLDLAIPAAYHGCHLLIEKPISNSMDGIPDLVDIVRKNNIDILIGYHLRFHPTLQKVKSLLDQEVIGKVISFRASWGEYLPDWHPWEDYKLSYSARADLGGGVILTLSHVFDYLGWMFGDVEELRAYIFNQGDLGLDVEDVADINLKYKNGTTGSVHLDYYQRPPEHFLEVMGTGGSLKWNYQSGEIKLHQADMADPEVLNPPDGFNRNDMYIEEMKHFINVIHGKTEPVCTLDEGIKTLQICLESFNSNKKGEVITFSSGNL